MKVNKVELNKNVKRVAELYPHGSVVNDWTNVEIEDEDIDYVVFDCLKDISQEGLGFCGCGCPEDTLEVLRLILIAQQEKDFNSQMVAYNNICGLESRNKNYESLIAFVLYILNDKGFLEHGGSIGGSWLSDDGKLLLYFLELNKSIEDENASEE